MLRRLGSELESLGAMGLPIRLSPSVNRRDLVTLLLQTISTAYRAIGEKRHADLQAFHCIHVL
jgi:hypothetical protein